jgi:protein SCO1
MRNALAALFVLCACIFVGCKSAPAKHYPLAGVVISVDAGQKMITVKHGDIAGLMPAMTMTYQVADPKEIATLQSGDTISGDLVVSENVGRLEKIVLISKGDGKTVPGTTQRIPAKGEEVPDFTLVNQDGKAIHLRDFEGKTLLVTFIYTRCPLPDYCPRMNENFRAVQKLLKDTPDAAKRVVFLSISFDPQHDTPSVLKHYGAIYRKSAPGEQAFEWQFAAPSEKDLSVVAQYFGLVYQPEEAQIVHSLSTTLIGPDGKIAEWYSGNDWSAQDVAKAVQTAIRNE